MSLLAWILIGSLGLLSAGVTYSRGAKLGILGFAATGFCAVAFLTTMPSGIIWLFWIFWFISLAVIVGLWTKLRTAGRWAAAALPGFAAMTAILMVGLFAATAVSSGANNGIVMALPLPGGGVQNVAVVGSLKVDDTTLEQRAERYAAIMDKECPTGVRYFANEAEAGTNQMGPTIQVDTVEAGKYRWDIKKVCDPLWLATEVHAIKYGTNLVQTQVQAEAQSYLADPAKRIAAVQFVDAQVVELRLVDAGAVQYRSLGMIPDKNGGMPTLTQFANQPALGYALVGVLKDGTVRYHRVTCDIQFSSPLEIKGVAKPAPEKAEKPPKVPPTVVTTPPTTTTRTTTSTPSTSTSTTTTTPGTSTTTTTPSTSTSTTTTTPPSSTTTTTETTSTTTTTTTTSPPSSTTTTSTKGDGPAPSGMPTDTTHGPVETTAPVEPTQANPGTQPGNADPGQTAPEATQEPTQEPQPTVQPTGGADPTNPHEGDVDPDATTTVMAMGFGGTDTNTMIVGLLMFVGLVVASVIVRRKELAASIAAD